MDLFEIDVVCALHLCEEGVVVVSSVCDDTVPHIHNLTPELWAVGRGNAAILKDGIECGGMCGDGGEVERARGGEKTIGGEIGFLFHVNILHLILKLVVEGPVEKERHLKQHHHFVLKAHTQKKDIQTQQILL